MREMETRQTRVYITEQRTVLLHCMQEHKTRVPHLAVWRLIALNTRARVHVRPCIVTQAVSKHALEVHTQTQTQTHTEKD